MSEFISFTIVGLSVAAIYAVIASGLVLTYTTTGVFNFAHGAIGMLAAFTYWQLRFDWGWPTPIALVVVLLILAPLFGVLLESRDHPRPAGHDRDGEARRLDLVAARSMIGSRNWIWEPDVSRPMANVLRARSSRSTSAPTDDHVSTRLITIAVAILVAIGLRFLLYRHAHRHRHAGRGRRPPARRAATGPGPTASSMLAWAIGTSLAALGGILIVAPASRSIRPSLSLLIVNAYAAAIFGRLRSLPLTFLGAIVLGLTEGYLRATSPREQPVPRLGAASRGAGRSCCSSCCSSCPTRACGPR